MIMYLCVCVCAREGRGACLFLSTRLHLATPKSLKVCVCCFQLKPTLSQLHADLKLYEHHFEWLNKVSKKHHHPALPKLVEMIREMKSLITLLHRQVKSQASTFLILSLSHLLCDK